MLGSTGSIGTQTLQVVRHLRDVVEVVALTAGQNARLLSQQLAEFRPRLYHSLVPEQVDCGDTHLATPEEIATDDRIDTVIVATEGRAGLRPTLAALTHGKRVALANKEVLVMAGNLVREAAQCTGAAIMPIDSEHSAIWQCLNGETTTAEQVLLTASGGPFYDCSNERLSNVTAAEALAHPIWAMGSKITIDSATLMNKGLEVIEAHWLFDVPYEKIQVLIHPECIVHSMVEFIDGSVKAQLSSPDMTLAIQYALTYPERLRALTQPLAWDAVRTLTFLPVDTDRFACLRLARDAGRAGRTYPAVLCGADEEAVDLFLAGAIRLPDIANLVDRALQAHNPADATSLEAIIAADDWARDYVKRHCSSPNNRLADSRGTT